MKDILKIAIPQTIPVLISYIFAGMAFGILLNQLGYSYWWALFISCTVYAGTMQFVLLSFLDGGVALLNAALITLAVNLRHAFYGLSFIETFNEMGLPGQYMIFSLTDETYALMCQMDTVQHQDISKIRLAIAMLNQSYWISGCVLGAMLGSFIPFNLKGIEFAMPSLFMVMFVEQWRSKENHFPSIFGISIGLIALLILGADHFILPALSVVTLTFFLIGNQKLESMVQ
ncbi:MAG: branched-chain amino acid ABC transporter permease [Eubacteriaceae bacterium]|jgi:4-azaleucine resistance transporter AzlC|nr:branched-chain amino acid ABC transporter permease [Eubacteriaceae bacterium]